MTAAKAAPKRNALFRTGATLPTLDDIKAALGIDASDTSKDAALTANMQATIAVIEGYLQRGIAFGDEIQNFEPVESRNPKLLLFRFPVTEVRSVTLDGADLTGWRVLKSSGIIEWRDGCGCPVVHGCCDHEPVIAVDYSGGYPDDAWPADLLDAVMRAFYARWNATGGTGSAADASGTGAAIRGVTVDGLTVQYGDAGAAAAEFGGGPVPAELVGVAAILDPYRQRYVTGI